MNIGIIVYAYVLVEPLEALLRHIWHQSENITPYIFLHSNMHDVRVICDAFSKRFQHSYFFDYGVNRGLAKSANQAFHQGYVIDHMDVMLTANDDVMPAPGDILKIARAAYHNRDKWIVEGMGTVRGERARVEWALAAVNPIAFEKVGYFDENFFPAYYEDTDYRYRAKLAGLETLTVEDTDIRHIGSASIKLTSQVAHSEFFRRNQSYYLRKWGSERGYEVFKTPFGDKALDFKIPYETRHNPYPEYARKDIGVGET